jgi:signal transduction histidine kinase
MMSAPDPTDSQALQLARLQRELQGLNYAVSHDLRAPVRAIIGFSQALKEQTVGKLDDNAAHFLERIEQATQRLSAMIDGLLQLSRLTQTEMHYAAVDLSLICADVVSELQQQYPQHPAQLRIAAGMQAWCDPRLIRIALFELLSNAFKFTRQRSQAEISISSTPAAGGATWCVRDNGRGFDMRYVDRLFMPFQHLQTRSELDGLGTGLASVQRIIHRHTGHIWAEGMPEQFAAFYFTLPAVQLRVG